MEKLIEILNSLHPDVDFENNDSLIDDGILDSLDIVSLVTEINSEFDVTIPAEEIVPENFNSAKALMELITRHGTVIPMTRLIKCFSDPSGSTLNLLAASPTPI